MKRINSEALMERFIRYVKINTQSDRHLAGKQTPSTECQWDLLHLLESECKDYGLETFIDAKGYIIATLPSNLDKEVETIGFMAHVDTAGDASGKDVNPQVYRDYDGKPIQLKDGFVLDPEDQPLLKKYIGETLISSDGTTLLGADDKAGVAEMMQVVDYLSKHPEIKHGPVEFIFTPDEETGRGMDHFPYKKIKSAFCYTMDGGADPEIEVECYNAWGARISFKGRVIHPGYARGKLINALSMASLFISLLPRNESPEATDGYYGNYWPQFISGSLESASLDVMLRDHNKDEALRRLKALDAFAKAVEAAFPGGVVTVETENQYNNLKEGIDAKPEVLTKLKEAIRRTGEEPEITIIRGGTDGARLTEQGIPTPNVFAGGIDIHSKKEWVSLSAMTKAAAVILNLIEIQAEG